MRIHNLLIAGALAGLMATAGTTQAQGMTAPLHFTSSGHKHVRKHHVSEKHLTIRKDGGKTRTAGGTVSRELIGKSNRSAKHSGLSRRFSNHHVKSSNARMSKKHSTTSSKRYQ